VRACSYQEAHRISPSYLVPCDPIVTPCLSPIAGELVDLIMVYVNTELSVDVNKEISQVA
jgi:hypothetical protein